MAKKIIFCFLLCFFLFPKNVFGQGTNTYFVAVTGNDSNLGTQAQPWRTIQKAATIAMAGDTITVLAGNYTERIQVTRSGNTGLSITYQAQGTVVMKGFTVPASYITIRGFEISVGTDNGAEGTGVHSTGNYNLIENNILHGCAWGGITVGGSSSNSTARNNRIYHNGQQGIQVYGTNNLIEDNDISDSMQYFPGVATPSWADADGIRFFGSGHIIRGNYIHDIKYGPLGVNFALGDYNNNPHIDCFQTWTDSGHAGGSNILFEQNFCDNLQSQALGENGSGFMLAQANHITIKNNVIKAYGGVNNGGGGVSYLNIYNNLWVGDMSFNISYFPFAVDVTGVPYAIVKNNIFYNQPYHTLRSTGTAPAGQEIDYNLAYNSSGKAADCFRVGDFVCKTTPSHDLWNVNPLFVNPSQNNFHLQSTSPAINSGANLAGIVTDDKDGASRPQGAGYDIGPFEYVGSISTPTPTPIPCPLKTQGDANCDGVINILDFETWRREFLGIDTTIKSDFDSSGGVTILDFEIWRRGFLK